ncbi:MAG: uroporphyrinogen decarboxylase [Anaerolineales bacterium]
MEEQQLSHPSMKDEPKSRFLRACQKLPTDATPVWFMRQAGRYLPEYRTIRAKHTILEICQTPELAAAVTLQPVRRFPLDAAILFADILLPLLALGFQLEFVAGEGPRITPSISSNTQLWQRPFPDLEQEFWYLAEAIKLIKNDLGDIPLIGFCGAPFTVASYLIEGGSSRDFVKTKKMLYTAPSQFCSLMETLANLLSEYLSLQIRSGVQAVQVFDSWVGVLSPLDYERFVLPYSQKVIAAAQEQGVPLIHFGTGSATLLPLMKKAGGNVMGIDWRIPLDQAWDELDEGWAIQGNLDPVALFAPKDELKKQVWEVLKRADGRSGHIFNLGHGVLPQTPLENVQAVVDWVHEGSLKIKTAGA